MPAIDEAIKYATSNEKEIQKSKIAGCYFCLRVYPASEITDEDYLVEERTAMCPHCQVNAVLPDTSGFELSTETLEKIHNYYF